VKGFEITPDSVPINKPVESVLNNIFFCDKKVDLQKKRTPNRWRQNMKLFGQKQRHLAVFVISEFLDQLSFHQLFDKVFKKLRKVRQYEPSQNASLLMAMLIAGGERLGGIGHFSDGQTVCELFDMPSEPFDTSLRDAMRLIGQNDNARDELLLQLNETLFDKSNIHSITVDIDGAALPVDGYQKVAAKGCCPAERGSRCFQSVKAVCNAAEMVIAEKTMSGDRHLRSDAGFYSDALMRFMESHPNVNYES
jgi:hypothetical protein